MVELAESRVFSLQRQLPFQDWLSRAHEPERALFLCETIFLRLFPTTGSRYRARPVPRFLAPQLAHYNLIWTGLLALRSVRVFTWAFLLEDGVMRVGDDLSTD